MKYLPPYPSVMRKSRIDVKLDLQRNRENWLTGGMSLQIHLSFPRTQQAKSADVYLYPGGRGWEEHDPAMGGFRGSGVRRAPAKERKGGLLL